MNSSVKLGIPGNKGHKEKLHLTTIIARFLAMLEVWLNHAVYNDCVISLSLSVCVQLGGWAVSGQWNQTEFNSTLSLLMRDYATFPFFNLYVGKDPNEITRSTTKRYIQVSLH